MSAKCPFYGSVRIRESVLSLTSYGPRELSVMRGRQILALELSELPAII